MLFSLLGRVASRQSSGIRMIRPGRSVYLPFTLLLKKFDASKISVHRYVHSTQTKSHLTFLLKNNDITPFQKFTVRILKEQCKTRGLKLSGRKSELLQRLITYDSASHKKSSVKVDELRKSSLINEPIKLTEKLLSDKIPQTIEKKHYSVQKSPNIETPGEVHSHLQPRDRTFLVGFFLLSCLWWNLEPQESKPIIDH
ncbi:Aim34p [Saccharomyces paradoxus]|uniref:Aim34p n=1 Tax=Saccharomyces paradoxus TaxID=27291 RepID=A0A8B8UX20_SACPA|nr:Aim34 [Saccharomyces paradoxus]QHS75283.1 Aim34 [Saccharomyces paradoxus]